MKSQNIKPLSCAYYSLIQMYLKRRLKSGLFRKKHHKEIKGKIKQRLSQLVSSKTIWGGPHLFKDPCPVDPVPDMVHKFKHQNTEGFQTFVVYHVGVV